MFRRRWGIAADDFVFPGGFEIFLRIVWLFVVMFAFFIEDSGLQAHCGESYGHLEGFLIGSMVLQATVFVTTTIIVIISALGTLSDDRPRRHIVIFLYFRCFLFLPEASLAVFGAYYIAQSDIMTLPLCPALIKMICLFGVLCSITVLLVTFIIIWFIFDPWGASQRLRDKRRTDPNLSIEDAKQLKYRQRAEASNIWETRLRTICCCFVSDTDVNRSALKDVAGLFSEMFEVEDDVVPSDIAAGLVLVQRRQKIVLQRNPSSPEFDRPARPLPWMTASNLSYFSRYALSIYGWPLFVFMNPCTGPFELLKRRSCCGCHRDIDIPVVGRDSQCYLAGLEALLDLPRVRLIHCSFVNNVFTCPFFIAIDDDAKAVVISVRGTMSFMDAITDVMTHCEPLFEDSPADTPPLLAHRGIMKAADNLLLFLRQSQILDSALETLPDYSVITTGHSLGAGVASILALKLQHQFQNSASGSASPLSATKVRCFAFSPPGGLLSSDAHKLSRNCIMSVVLDLDFIPRLSYHTFVKLKDDLMGEIKKADEPKFEILAKGFCSALGRCAVDCCGQRRRRRIRRMRTTGDGGEAGADSPKMFDDEDRLLNDGSASSYTEGLIATIPEAHASEDSGVETVGDNVSMRLQPKLYPPGQILLLQKEESSVTYGRWVGPEHFQNIIVGTTMMTDHLPDRVFLAVNDFCETQKSGLNRV